MEKWETVDSRCVQRSKAPASRERKMKKDARTHLHAALTGPGEQLAQRHHVRAVFSDVETIGFVVELANSYKIWMRELSQHPEALHGRLMRARFGVNLTDARPFARWGVQDTEKFFFKNFGMKVTHERIGANFSR